MELIPPPTDPHILQVLSEWPSMRRFFAGEVPKNLRNAWQDELELDILTHIVRCELRQNSDVADFSPQQGFAEALRFLREIKEVSTPSMDSLGVSKSHDSRKAMELAFLLKDLEIPKALIEAGVKNFGGKMLPAHVLCKEFFIGRIGSLTAHLDLAFMEMDWRVASTDSEGNTALHLAANNPCIGIESFKEIVAFTRKHGDLAGILALENQKGQTPLLLCIPDLFNLVSVQKIMVLLAYGDDPYRTSSAFGHNIFTWVAYCDSEFNMGSSDQYTSLLAHFVEIGGEAISKDEARVDALASANDNQEFMRAMLVANGQRLSPAAPHHVIARL